MQLKNKVKLEHQTRFKSRFDDDAVNFRHGLIGDRFYIQRVCSITMQDLRLHLNSMMSLYISGYVIIIYRETLVMHTTELVVTHSG